MECKYSNYCNMPQKIFLIYRERVEKGYARPYEADNRPLYQIGVSFSSETGTVSDWKVK